MNCPRSCGFGGSPQDHPVPSDIARGLSTPVTFKSRDTLQNSNWIKKKKKLVILMACRWKVDLKNLPGGVNAEE